jgi:phosphoribosyl 1,2-cyclic phosphodiesterase
MRLRVLGSSSAGNSTLIWTDRNALLVDCGFSPRYLLKQLSSLGVDLSAIGGVVFTHAHGDHVRDETVSLLLESRVPVYVRHELAGSLAHMYPSLARASRLGMLRSFDGGGVEIGSLEVEAFPVPHDSPGGCFGFSVSAGTGTTRRRVTYATDLGFIPEGLEKRFRDADAIVIESNHDTEMLENSGRPPWLKKRIRDVGHLSNDQCAAFVAGVVGSSTAPPRGIVLAHLSQQCNTPLLAEKATTTALRAGGCSAVTVLPSFRSAPSGILEF